MIEPRDLKAARLAAIQADLRRHAAQPHFNVGALAKRHGPSVRYVQIILAESGKTFSEYLLEERLDLAYRILCGVDALGRSITSIALDAGFNDLSYFHRCFRRRYGASPGDIRNANHHREAFRRQA